MDNLEEYKSQLRDLLPEKGGIFVVGSLLEKLPEQSAHYNALISLKKRYKDLKINSISGILSTDEQTRLEAVLDKQVLELIQILEASDFDRKARRSQLTDKQKIRRGHVLYRVPKEMQLQEEYRCLVRIAFDEEMVLEDLEMDDDTALKSGIRISQYMKVEIKDPNADAVFEIRSSSEPVQFIDEDDFTEWRFYVKPLKAGKHMLELTVTIIQRINGEDRVRERTLEESVVIITEPVAESEEDLPWQRDEQALAMPLALHTITPKSSAGLGGFMRNGAMSVAVLLALTGAVYAFGPAFFAEQIDWLKARYLQNTEKAYDNFLDKHPNSNRKETATFKRAQAILRNQPGERARGVEAMARYAETYGEQGQHADAVYWTLATETGLPDFFFHYQSVEGPHPNDETAKSALAEMESRFWSDIIGQSAVLGLDRYLRLYPEGEYRQLILGQLADSMSWQRMAEIPLGTVRDTAGWRQRMARYAQELDAAGDELGQQIIRWLNASQAPPLRVVTPTVKPAIDRTSTPREETLTSNQEGNSTSAPGTGAQGNAGDGDKLVENNSSGSSLANTDPETVNGTQPANQLGSQPPTTTTTPAAGGTNTTGSVGENAPSVNPGNTSGGASSSGGGAAPPATTLTNPATNTRPDRSSTPAGQENSTTPSGGSVATAVPPTTNNTNTANSGTGGGPTTTTVEDASPSPPKLTTNPTILGIANDLVRVSGGSFTMGCEQDQDANCDEHEGPAREVSVSTFYLSKYEVTQAQWRAVMGRNPAFNTGCDQCPVEQVSWNDIQDFLRTLNAQTGQKYRLPSEAEWEYAARGGSSSKKYLYSGSNNIEAVGWYQKNARLGNPHGSKKSTWPVGNLKANSLGLYDMSGNVREWVEDCWHEDYAERPANGKAWLRSQAGDCDHRVLRGGSWGNRAEDCRVAARMRILRNERVINFGFRLARN